MKLLAGRQILIADQNRFLAGILNGMLRSLGVSEIHVCTTPEMAFDVTQAHAIDAALIDHRIGVRTALPLVRQIRCHSQQFNASMPIILLSDNPSGARLREAVDAGVDEILVKPLSQASVLSRLKWVLAQPRAYIKAGGYSGPDRRRRQIRPFGGPERRGRQRAPGRDMSTMREVVEL